MKILKISERQRIIARRTCRKTECSKADGIEMGKGLSVPDSNMLISLADELDTSVSILLGETVQEPCVNELDLKSISEKLGKINLQFAKRSKMRIQTIRYLLLRCVRLS